MSAKTRAGKKALEAKGPKIIENRKKSLFIKGRKFPSVMRDVWDDLATFRFGEIVKFSRENDILPFESSEELEKHCRLNDCSLFAFFTHNKKKPYDLVFGRLFNHVIMDMFEFGVDKIVERSVLPKPSHLPGDTPALVFQGDQWDTELSPLRSFFIDFFVGDMKGHVDLHQVTHMIVLTATEEGKRILFRHYNVKDANTTNPEVSQICPCFDMVRRRERVSDESTLMAAMNKAPEEKKKKNIKRDALGRDIGRVFVGKNDVAKLRMKKFAGLPKRRVIDENHNTE